MLLLWFRAKRCAHLHPLPPVVSSVDILGSSFFLNSLGKLICGNWVLINFLVDVRFSRIDIVLVEVVISFCHDVRFFVMMLLLLVTREPNYPSFVEKKNPWFYCPSASKSISHMMPAGV